MSLSEPEVPEVLLRARQSEANTTELKPGAVVGYTLLETEPVIARFVKGTLLAADSAFRHKGACLSSGSIRNGELMCQHHSWTLAEDGAFEPPPSLFEPSPDLLAFSYLHTYQVQERYRFVSVKRDDQPLADGRVHDLLNVPEFDDARWSDRHGSPTKFAAGWYRGAENYLDITHSSSPR